MASIVIDQGSICFQDTVEHVVNASDKYVVQESSERRSGYSLRHAPLNSRYNNRRVLALVDF